MPCHAMHPSIDPFFDAIHAFTHPRTHQCNLSLFAPEPPPLVSLPTCLNPPCTSSSLSPSNSLPLGMSRNPTLPCCTCRLILHHHGPVIIGHSPQDAFYRVRGEFVTVGSSLGLTLRLSSLRRAALPTMSVRLTNFTLGFTCDLQLTPGPSPPFLKAVNVSFPTPPRVYLRIRAMERGPFDVAGWPGLSEWLSSEINRALAPLVCPGFLEVNFLSAAPSQEPPTWPSR